MWGLGMWIMKRLGGRGRVCEVWGWSWGMMIWFALDLRVLDFLL